MLDANRQQYNIRLAGIGVPEANQAYGIGSCATTNRPKDLL
jgi:hypothetical protein